MKSLDKNYKYRAIQLVSIWIIIFYFDVLLNTQLYLNQSLLTTSLIRNNYTFSNILLNINSYNLNIIIVYLLFVLSIIQIIKPLFVSTILQFLLLLNINTLIYPVLNSGHTLIQLLISYSIIFLLLEKVMLLKTNQKYFINTLKLQIGIMYLFTGLAKFKGENWINASAIKAVYSNPNFSNLSQYVSNINDIVFTTSNYIVLFFEITFFIFIINKKLRNTYLIAGTIFHILVMVTLNLYSFSFAIFIYYILFVSTEEKKIEHA